MACGDNNELHVVPRREILEPNLSHIHCCKLLYLVPSKLYFKVELVYSNGGPENSHMLFGPSLPARRQGWYHRNTMSLLGWRWHRPDPKDLCCPLKCAEGFLSLLWSVIALWKEAAAPVSENFRCGRRRLVRFRLTGITRVKENRWSEVEVSGVGRILLGFHKYCRIREDHQKSWAVI